MVKKILWPFCMDAEETDFVLYSLKDTVARMIAENYLFMTP